MDNGNNVLSCLCHYCFGFFVTQNGTDLHLIQFDCDHKYYQLYSSVQFSHSVVSHSLLIPWTAARQASLSITNSWSLFKLMSIESVMPSNHLILGHPLLLPPSIFPSIGVFSNESVLHIRWPSIGVSASPSVLPMNTQD